MLQQGEGLLAGASAVDITPTDSQFLYGYPHVKRYSTGVHDSLMSSALYVSDGGEEVMIIANDLIYVPQDVVASARQRIEQKTGVPAGNIMITATHTHSGPMTIRHASNTCDEAVPQPDGAYLTLVEDGIVQAGVEAHSAPVLAEMSVVQADGTGLGTNRRDPTGPADPRMPVLLVRKKDDQAYLAAMVICSMHPTVLHEDSTLVSGDFPGLARQILQMGTLGKNCVILNHMGPAGNQSPRHVTKENTFTEAKRLGAIFASAVEKVLEQAHYCDRADIRVARKFLDLRKRSFPPVEQAQAQLDNAIARLEGLRSSGAARTEIRTAECDWFGAEETLSLAMSAQNGELDRIYDSVLPAEVQVISLGDWNFVGWPCEIFVEYSLAVKAMRDGTFVMSCANGELQGYIVTKDAAEVGGYEASNSLFDYTSGSMLVEATLELTRSED